MGERRASGRALSAAVDCTVESGANLAVSVEGLERQPAQLNYLDCTDHQNDAQCKGFKVFTLHHERFHYAVKSCKETVVYYRTGHPATCSAQQAQQMPSSQRRVCGASGQSLQAAWGGTEVLQQWNLAPRSPSQREVGLVGASFQRVQELAMEA